MKKTLVIFIAGIICAGVSQAQNLTISKDVEKVAITMAIIENSYVDSVDTKKLSEDVIKAALEKLDPHSSYISTDELQRMNEPLDGNFEGIGISFNIMRDTLFVIETISGGPSERVGLQPGDRIIAVNDSIIAGRNKPTTEIMSLLRGKKGTEVRIKVLRRNNPNLIDFKIIRDKIPIYSLEAAYMVNDSIGYIQLSRFGATTFKEFKDACKKLQDKGMKRLILDLESNGGGYMESAIYIVNEFLKQRQLIVYTEGKHQPRLTADAFGKGTLNDTKLVIMINERSASASEIVAGAIQDWDRGVIVGRRSFAKGLVQQQRELPDGSAIRLTVARYYTPSGRSIQKPYKYGDSEAYQLDILDRYNKGEMMSADSIHLSDSLKYKTLVNKRTVYGGGGIMPDQFVPMDTTYHSNYMSKLVYAGIVNQTVLNEVDIHRKQYVEKYPDAASFIKDFTISDEILDKVKQAADKEKIEFDEDQYNKSLPLLKLQMKALMGRDLFNNETLLRIMNSENETYQKAVEIIQDTQLYNSLLTAPQEDK